MLAQKILKIECVHPDLSFSQRQPLSPRNAQLPKGISNHIYNFPEAYNVQEYGKSMLIFNFTYDNIIILFVVII
jgi:hypothetical protein